VAIKHGLEISNSNDAGNSDIYFRNYISEEPCYRPVKVLCEKVDIWPDYWAASLALPGARFRLSPNSNKRELAAKLRARSHVHTVSERTLS
jgi:hypothetical protein